MPLKGSLLNTFYFVCDESGAKGNSDKGECSQDRIGVFSGFILRSIPNYQRVSSILDGIRNTIAEPYQDNKLHMSDLTKNDQDIVQYLIFDFFKKEKINCLYEAIYSEAFHQQYLELKKGFDETCKKSLKSRKIITEKRKPKSLHEELFIGLFLRLIGFITDTIGHTEFTLNILIDRVDNTVVSKFKKRIEKSLNWTGESENEVFVSYFDQLEKKPVKEKLFTIKSKLTSPKDFVPPDFSKIKVNIETIDDAMTLAADVLSYSIWKHLEKSNNFSPKILTDFNAISGHEMANNMVSLSSEEGGYLFNTRIYRHPEMGNKKSN